MLVRFLFQASISCSNGVVDALCVFAAAAVLPSGSADPDAMEAIVERLDRDCAL